MSQSNLDEELRTQVEDWLDNAYHNGEIDVQFGITQKVAEILTPNIKAHEDKLVREAKISELKLLRETRANHTHPIGKGSVSSSYVAVTAIDARLAELSTNTKGEE